MGMQSLKHLALVLTVVIAGGLAATAASPLSGTWEMGIAFNPSATTFAGLVQTDSDTYTKLTVNYVTDGWTFASISTFEVSGFSTQEFTASGSLGLITLINSRLTFSPILGSSSSTLSYSKTTNTPTHDYNLGRQYFIGSVSATGVKVDSAATEWCIRVSRDGTSWSSVSEWFTGDGASGEITVNRLAQYVQIYTDATKSHYVDESSIVVTASANSFTTTARLVTGGLTFDGGSTIATTGSSCSLTVTGATPDDGLTASATTYFSMSKTDCSLSFDRIQGTFGFAFACLDKVTATWKVDCTGFDQLSFSVTGLDFGLSCITFDATLVFSLLEKTVTLTPRLNLENDTCFTVYASLVTATADTWEITGLTIYGLGVKHSWNGLSFESLSYFDGIHRVKDTYWEKFTIKSTGDSCCGGKLSFDVFTYFQDTHTTLFDWAETKVELSIGLTSAFTGSTSIVVDMTGFTELKLGLKATW
jgi:hypothetical protein